MARSSIRSPAPWPRCSMPTGEAADELVRAGEDDVGAGEQGLLRQRLVEREVGTPGLVDDQRYAPPVRTPASPSSGCSPAPSTSSASRPSTAASPAASWDRRADRRRRRDHPARLRARGRRAPERGRNARIALALAGSSSSRSPGRPATPRRRTAISRLDPQERRLRAHHRPLLRRLRGRPGRCEQRRRRALGRRLHPLDERPDARQRCRRARPARHLPPPRCAADGRDRRLDISANALFALATTTGLLSIVGIFGSL